MRKHVFSSILLFSLSLSLMPYSIEGMRRRAHQTHQQPEKDKKATIEQSLSKLFSLKWSKLTKEDAANFTELGLAIGGLYILFRHTDLFDYRNISPDYMYERNEATNDGVQHDAAWLDQEEEQTRECASCWEDFSGLYHRQPSTLRMGRR